MNNLFKKGFASLALASAMTSSIFAGNAAYIDIKVNYLGGEGVAVLGYEDTTAKNDNRDKVELLISVLDKDGLYADKNENGDTLGPIGIEDNLSNTSGSINGILIGEINGKTSRALEAANSAQRIVLDYTVAVAKSDLIDEIKITSGKLSRKTTIKLQSVDAEGLIVRATPNGKIKQEFFVNANFSDINASGESQMLNFESSKAPGGLVGIMIPIQVYASNFANNVSVDGNFTLAPNLDGKTIVIQALADYNDTAAGITQTVLNSIEVTMKNGQAFGEIKITNGMPGDGHGIGVTPPSDVTFEVVLTDGLGIAFVAYVKDEQSINNYSVEMKDDTDLVKDFTFDKMMRYWGSAAVAVAGRTSTNTDTIQVKSGEPVSLKVGEFDHLSKTVAKLWTKTSSIITISDGNDILVATDYNTSDINATHQQSVKTLTAVDSYGNPAMVTIATGAIVADIKFGSKATNKFVKVTPSVVLATAGSFHNSKSIIQVLVTDSNSTNSTKAIKTIDFTVNASKGMLSAVDSIALTARTLPLVEYSVDGGSSWKKGINDVNTTDNFKLASGSPLFSADKIVKSNANTFSVVLKSGLGDGNLTDQNSTFRLFILDKTGDEEYLEGTELEKYLVKAIAVNGEKNITFGSADAQPFGNGKTYTYTNGVRGDETGADDGGYFRFDYNSSNKTTAVDATPVNFNIAISKKDGDVLLANILVRNYNARDNEDEALIHIPVYEDKKTDAYVSVYLGEDVEKDEALPGTVVNFKFTGKAIKAGDPIVIDMNSTGLRVPISDDDNDSHGRIGLVGSTIASNTDGTVKTTLPENGIVSIVLYDVNNTNAGSYHFNDEDGNASRAAVLINGMKPVWLNIKDDDETKDIMELSISDTIKMEKSNGGETISIVNLALTTNNTGTGSGVDDDNIKNSPATAGSSKKPITTKIKVLTGLYYGFFAADTDVKLTDKYGNQADKVDNELGDIELSATEGIEFNDDGKESWIRFKDSAAGTDQTLTVSYVKDDKTKVSNTITWTNIALSKTNTGFIIKDNFGGFVDPNTGIFDVVNSEIVVKIVGNGYKKQSGTTIKLSHTDKDAKFRLVKLTDLDSNLYENVLSGLDDSIKTGILADGSYYIVSADKPGDLTIAVSSETKDDKGKKTPISATHVITFDAIDLDKPMVVESGVVASGGTITIDVTDKNLDTVKTLVTVSDINDATKSIVKAVYTDGKYVAQVSSAGIYQIEVLGVDMADNRQRFNFARTVGEGAGTLEDSLVANGSYAIDGTFAPYDFKDVDSSFDWVYTQGTTMNQLNAKGSKDASAFKWAPVTDITPGTKNVWYMIKLTGTAGTADAAGAYGWVLVNAKGDTFKLAGANEDGTFKFSKALYVKGTMSGSNISFAKR